MDAIKELEGLIHLEYKKIVLPMPADYMHSLAREVADKLHYTFETSLAFHGKEGAFLSSSQEMINLLRNLGYVTVESPIFFDEMRGRYVGELTLKAREIYNKLKEQRYYAHSNLAQTKLFIPGPNLIKDKGLEVKPREEGLLEEKVLV